MDVGIQCDLEQGGQHTIPHHSDPAPVLLGAGDTTNHEANDQNEIHSIPNRVANFEDDESFKFELEREGYIDKEGRQWSIELKPSGESRAECQKRIKTDYEELLSELDNKTGFIPSSVDTCLISVNFPPTWMTANFLYRINYGPITMKDRCLVRDFLIDQNLSLEARRRRKTMSSLCGWSWKSLLPGRTPIRNIIGRRIWGASKIFWSPAEAKRVPALFCFFEPKVVSILRLAICPYLPAVSEKSTHSRPFVDELTPKTSHPKFAHYQDLALGRVILELEFRLNMITEGAPRNLLLVPNAALVSAAVSVAHQVRALSASGAIVTHETLDLDKAYSLPKHLRVFSFDAAGCKYPYPYIEDISRKLGLFDGFARLGILEAIVFHPIEPGPNLWPYIRDSQGRHRLEVKDDTVFDIDRSKEGKAKMARVIQKASSLKLHLSHIDAAFISSGPFCLMLTTNLDAHLVLGDDGYLRVYWDFEPVAGSRLGMLKGHFIWDNSNYSK